MRSSLSSYADLLLKFSVFPHDKMVHSSALSKLPLETRQLSWAPFPFMEAPQGIMPGNPWTSLYLLPQSPGSSAHLPAFLWTPSFIILWLLQPGLLCVTRATMSSLLLVSSRLNQSLTLFAHLKFPRGPVTYGDQEPPGFPASCCVVLPEGVWVVEPHPEDENLQAGACC